MQASIIRSLFQARINWEGCSRKGIWHKHDGGEGTNSLDRVASRRIVGASASVIFPFTIKSRRWRAVMEEVDKGYSEFCITVGTVTRTACILIHSRLKALAVNVRGSCLGWGQMFGFWLTQFVLQEAINRSIRVLLRRF